MTIMSNEGLINLVAWCKRERERIQMQREMLQCGRFRIFNVEENRYIDVSEESIRQITVNLSELDLILEDYNARTTHLSERVSL